MADSFNNLEPVKVSPVIKGFRWAFLIAGITYGIIKKGALSIREVGIREEEEKRRKIHDEHIRKERDKQSQQELQMLADLFLGDEK